MKKDWSESSYFTDNDANNREYAAEYLNPIYIERLTARTSWFLSTWSIDREQSRARRREESTDPPCAFAKQRLVGSERYN